MKHGLGILIAGICMATAPAHAMPRDAFTADRYEEAKAKALETGMPLAIVATNLKSNCPKCQDGNKDVFRYMRNKYILVVDDSSSGEKLPLDVRRRTDPIYKSKGNIIPIVAVLTPSGDQLLSGLCYKQIEKGASNAFKTLETEVAEAMANTQAKDNAPAPEAGKTAPPAKQREWKNNEGRTITAEAIRRSADTVTFRMENGSIVDYPLEKLSDESRKHVDEILGED